MENFEMWYAIQRYEWAKKQYNFDELYPVIGYLNPESPFL